MIINILKYGFSLLILLLLQVTVLNHFTILGIATSYLYILYIITLPFDIPKGLLYTLAFITGLSVDIFCNTPGMHLLSTLLLAGFRHPVLLLFFAKEELESYPPSAYSLGLWRFMRYALTLALAHHFTLFLLESFTLFNLGQIILKTISSVLFTSFFIFCIETIKIARR